MIVTMTQIDLVDGRLFPFIASAGGQCVFREHEDGYSRRRGLNTRAIRRLYR